MDINETYLDIIEAYVSCKSITQIAKKLKVSEERVRRTLITEDLWTSRSAEPIVKLFREGKTVPEIAKQLMISVKTVQSYIPYSKGMYGRDRSDSALRSEEYRKRMRKAVDEMDKEVNREIIPEEELPEIMINRKWRFEDEPLKASDVGKKPWEKAKDSVGGERKYVYQLRFDLTGSFLYGADDRYDMSAEEYEDFLRLAKARKGISRTVLVPGEMSFHAMHYMILRLFGWQNEHLHRYALPEDSFRGLTDGEKIGKWTQLCGVLFRFPTGDNDDLYWDDDYEPNQSVKSWLRNKYKKSYAQRAVSESLVSSLSEIEELKTIYLGSTGAGAGLSLDNTLNDLNHAVTFEGDFNTLLERLRVCDLFLSHFETKDITKDEWLKKALDERKRACADIQQLIGDKKKKGELDEAMEELKQWRRLRSGVESALQFGRRVEIERQLGKKVEEVLADANYAIPEWEKDVFQTLDKHNPKIYPFLDRIYYLYDFGDDWCIRISCEKRYKRMTEWDFPDKNGYIVARTMKYKDGLKTYRYFDEEENEIKGEERDRLAEVDVKKTPICIASDGVYLVEDPGGVHGFYEMLKTLAGDDLEEKARTKEWAKGLGWTGRISEPKNML